MSRIGAKDTKPELIVRRVCHSLGFRFRLHRKDLPGKPDLVFPKHKKIIFVHGCFWHMHSCCYGKVKPKTNSEFWEKKRQGTVLRDKVNKSKLKKSGWRVIEVWECQTKDIKKLYQKIEKVFL